MATVVECQEFLSMLQKCELLNVEALQVAKEEALTHPDTESLAERLVQMGHLTRFQAANMLAGKFRGLTFGPYHLLDQVGKGGMGTVYLARHAKLQRKVAIKVLSRDLAGDKAAVERFMREGRAASALCHPNIVRVHHAGSAGGTHYLVMEYVDGVTLEQILDRRGPFTIPQAMKIGVQAAAGLQHAHEKGFVHRDIKPENLMLTKAGLVKVLDLGLTKDISRKEDNLTGMMQASLVLGTIDYLSPEQAIQGEVEPRSDIYSLGATIFTLITGHSPYEGVPMRQKLLQHQTAKPPSLTEFRADVPKELADVVSKMMARKLEDRYENAVAVVEALLPWTNEDGSEDNLIRMPSEVLRAPTNAPPSMTPTVREASRQTKVSPPNPSPKEATPAPAPVEAFDYRDESKVVKELRKVRNNKQVLGVVITPVLMLLLLSLAVYFYFLK